MLLKTQSHSFSRLFRSIPPYPADLRQQGGLVQVATCQAGRLIYRHIVIQLDNRARPSSPRRPASPPESLEKDRDSRKVIPKRSL
jgi:hypothetical protein